jgi:lipopolysaccharide transport system permease protein
MPFSQYFRLVDIMARMALRADATRFFLGYIWWVLEPLLWVAVLYLVFVKILGTRQPDFLLFLATGKLVFVWFSKSVTQASSSIVNGKGLVGKINVPKTLFPMAVIQEGLYRQSAVFVLLFAFLLAGGYHITATWWYLIPLMLVNYIIIVACAFAGACLVCVARDFIQLISLGMLFLMFTSGIFWDVRRLTPEKADMVLNMNPLAFVLDAYRQVMMYDTAPEMVHLLTIGAGFGALLCAMVLIMRHRSQYLALKALTA